MHRHGGRHRVEAGAEVRRGAGHAHPPPASHSAAPIRQHRPLHLGQVRIDGDHLGTAASAVSGSFSPWPVSTHTSSAAPAGGDFSTPATHAADAGSQNTPSCEASQRCASMISRSLTASIRPPDSSSAATASCQRAGLPMRIADATVSGCSTGWPSTIGAAPSAWNP